MKFGCLRPSKKCLTFDFFFVYEILVFLKKSQFFFNMVIRVFGYTVILKYWANWVKKNLCKIFPMAGSSGVFLTRISFLSIPVIVTLLLCVYIFQAEKYFFGSLTEPIAHTGSGNKNPHKSQFDSKWARKYFTCFIIHPPCNFCNV